MVVNRFSSCNQALLWAINVSTKQGFESVNFWCRFHPLRFHSHHIYHILQIKSVSSCITFETLDVRLDTIIDLHATWVQNSLIPQHLITHFPMSSEVRERASKWVQRSAQVKQAMKRKRMSKWCELTSERTSEWSSTFIWILGCSGP